MDKYRYVICILLLATGIVIGASIAGIEINYLLKWGKILEPLSNLSTIAMAAVAIYTLNAWREQFRYQKKFEAFQELGYSIDDLRVIHRHITNMEHYYCSKASGSEDSTLTEIEKALDDTGIKWSIAIERYTKAWRNCILFLSEKDIEKFPIPPHELREKIKKDLTKIVNDTIESTGQETCIYISFQCTKLNNEIIKILKDSNLEIYQQAQRILKN